MCVLCRALGSELSTLWHSDATAVYDDGAAAGGGTATIAYASKISQGSTNDLQADGLLSGAKWSGTVTYSFTDSPSDYASGYGYGEPTNGFAKVTVAEQQVVNTAMAQIEGLTNLNIQRNDEAGISDGAADIRIARSAEANPTAYAYYPGNSTYGEGGDVWIGTSYSGYGSPVLGNYAYATHLHEIGHALGLKHPHESGGVAGPLPGDHDALEFSIMSYRSYVGGSTSGGYTNEGFGYPQSYMMNDIAALQKMYGADFGFNNSDTVYTWNTATGEMSINGVGQGAPGANRVFLTIWDGGGNDTYDMSNYSTGVSINLQPGLWSVTANAQKAYLGDGRYAQGNVYNAFQYDADGAGSLLPDARSLIENAIGGAGNDTIIGNAADNRLDGRGGNDVLTGGAGDDLFVFHAGGGADVVTDFTAGGLVDEIYFDFTNVRSYAQAMSYATQVGADTVFNFGVSGTLTLLNVMRANLTVGDFEFSNPLPISVLPPTAVTLSGNTVAENAAGATVGAVTVSDPDGETQFTFTLSDSRFQVVGSPGSYSLVLKSGVALDYETEPSIGLDITATDSGGFWRTEHFTIDVLDRPGVTINGTSGNDTVDATHTVARQPLPTNDDDTIKGGAGNDVLSGLAGRDFIYGGSGNDILYGGDGDDTLYGEAGVDQLYGGNGNDTFVVAGSEAVSDTMLGGDGYDTLQVTGTSRISLAGFSAANSIEAWVGNNLGVVGTSANNILDFSGLISRTNMGYVDGGAGDDTITGSALADDLRGNTGNDVIYGGGGDDILYGQAGVDQLYGGDGNDTFVIAGSEAVSDTMLGGDGYDTILVTGTSRVSLAGFSAANSIEAWVGNNLGVVGTSANNILDFSGLTSRTNMGYVDGGAGNDIITGSAFADDLRGNTGDDVIYGGGGDDTLYGQAGVDQLYGGDGNDTFVIAGSEAVSDTMLGGDGYDTILVTGTKKVSLGGFSAANSIEAWVGNNLGVVGTAANDILDFSGLISRTNMGYVDGGAGNDTITGSAFGDDLRGNNGDDVIDGGGGNDLLNGGAGADTFIFRGDFGADRIVGFVAGSALGHDVIRFEADQFGGFADVMAHATQVGSDVVIALDANHSVTLQSMTLTKLVAADFQFV